MRNEVLSEYFRGDIHFLVETASPKLLSKINAIENDPVIVEGMIQNELQRLFRRIMLMSEETIATAISPRFLFDILLRIASREIENQTYTIERTATQNIPVFDSPEAAQFLKNRLIIKYLADMLSSFTRIESFTIPVRVRKGIWRRIRFNDMDVDCLIGMCQTVDEQHRFRFYKRLADLCLFIVGMFPEYVTMDYRYPSSGRVRPRLFGRLRRSVEDYEEEGRRFYKLAGEHSEAAMQDLSDVLRQLQDRFNLAKKPLNFISANFLGSRKEKLFTSLYSG